MRRGFKPLNAGFETGFEPTDAYCALTSGSHGFETYYQKQLAPLAAPALLSMVPQWELTKVSGNGGRYRSEVKRSETQEG